MSENDSGQNVRNKYGINRDNLKKAKNWKRGMGGKSEHGEKRRIKLDRLGWGIIIALIVDVILYISIASLDSVGYKLYRYGHIVFEHILFYGIIFWVIALIASLVSQLPRRASSRRIVVISMVVFCVVAAWLMFDIGKTAVSIDFRQCATLESEDGKTEIVVLRSDIKPAEEAPDSSHYTMYQAYRKLNYFFCDSKEANGLIIVVDGKDAPLLADWSDEGLRLYVDGGDADVDGEILVPLN